VPTQLLLKYDESENAGLAARPSGLFRIGTFPRANLLFPLACVFWKISAK